MKIRICLPVVTLSLLSVACAANIRQQASELTAAYIGAAGPAIPEFRNSRGLYSWQPLSDQELVVYTQPRTAYLLSVSFCPDLGSASAISLTSRLGWVTSGLDSVRSDNVRSACRIQQIRPVDLVKFEALRAAQRKP